MTHHKRMEFSLYPIGLRLFGVLFGGVSLLFVGMLADGFPVMVNGRPGTSADIPLAVFFVAIGVGLALAHGRATLDLPSGELILVHGWGPFVRTRRRSLSEVLHVGLGSSRGSKGPSYFVELQGSDWKQELASSKNEPRMLAQAQEMARFLGVPLHDSRGGEILVVPSEEAGRSILDHSHSERLNLRPPVHSRVALARTRTGTRIHWRNSNRMFLGLLLLGIVGMGLSYWWFVWFDPSAGGDVLALAFNYAPLAFVAVIVAASLASPDSNGVLSKELHVDRNGVLVAQHLLPRSEIQEVAVASGDGGSHLRLSTSDVILRVGHSLSRSELCYLRSLVLHGLRE